MPVRDAPGFDIDVSSADRFMARNVETRLEQCVIHSRDGATYVCRLIELAFSTLVVRVNDQLVEIVHVVAIRRSVICV